MKIRKNYIVLNKNSQKGIKGGTSTAENANPVATQAAESTANVIIIDDLTS